MQTFVFFPVSITISESHRWPQGVIVIYDSTLWLCYYRARFTSSERPLLMNECVHSRLMHNKLRIFSAIAWCRYVTSQFFSHTLRSEGVRLFLYIWNASNVCIYTYAYSRCNLNLYHLFAGPGSGPSLNPEKSAALSIIALYWTDWIDWNF